MRQHDPSNYSVTLRDGRTAVLRRLVCPYDSGDAAQLTALLNHEWQNGDLYWSESMAGKYADSLNVVARVAECDGAWLGTACVVYPVDTPRVAAVCEVMTRPDLRGLGIARACVEAVTAEGIAHGAQAVLLGTEREGSAWRVYQRAGYAWLTGGVMRCLAEGQCSFDEDFFAAGQSVRVRPSEWGDLPAVSALLATPYAALAGDYTRSMLSPRHTFHPRCVSAFPTIYYAVEAAGGRCFSLIGDTPHGVLGLASVTPMPGNYRGHVGVLEVMTHDNHIDHGPKLVVAAAEAARELGVRRLKAHVPVMDTTKAKWLRDAGASSIGCLPDQVMLEAESIDVEIYDWSI